MSERTGVVLYVESDRSRRRTVRNTLFWHGLHVIGAEGAVDALKLLEDRQVDCVVCPPVLPEMSLDLFQERIHERDSRLPVVLYGEGIDPGGDIPRWVSSHVTSDFEALADAVTDAIDRRRVDTALDRHRRLTRVVRTLAIEIAFLGEDEDRESIERTVYRHVQKADLYGFTWLAAYDSESDRLVPRFPSDIVLPTNAAGGAVAEALRTGEVHTESISETGRYRAVIPVGAGGTTYGILVLYATGPGVFGEAERGVLNEIGRIAGQALKQRAESQEPDELSVYADLVTHELRNHLQVAQSHLKRVQARGTSDRSGVGGIRHALAMIEHAEERAEHIDAVGQALERLDRLAEKVSVLAKDSFDQTEREPVDLESVAEEAWEATTTIEADLIVAESETVHANRVGLLLVLENLFRNAIQHGGTDVRVEVGVLSNGFYVEDSGPGLGSSERERVFEWGYSSRPDNTGVGLTLVRRVVEAHGWEIRLVDEGRGARFEITGIEAG